MRLLELRRYSAVTTLAAGMALGWVLAATLRPAATIRASAGDRWGDSIVTSGPVLVRYDERLKSPLAQDALYYLDYRAGRLLATVPSFHQSGGSTRLLDTFVERDLVNDFKLDAEAGPRPHFLMTTGSLGQYSEGWAPLFVFESTTNQVATYKVQQQMVGTSTKPSFELVEIRSIAPGTTIAAGN